MAPCIWQPLVLLRSTRILDFLGDDFWNYFRMQYSWFDSGYMFLPVNEVMWDSVCTLGSRSFCTFSQSPLHSARVLSWYLVTVVYVLCYDSHDHGCGQRCHAALRTGLREPPAHCELTRRRHQCPPEGGNSGSRDVRRTRLNRIGSCSFSQGRLRS